MKHTTYQVSIFLLWLLFIPAYLGAVTGPQLARVGNQPYIEAALGAKEGEGKKLWEWQGNIALYGVNATFQFDQCGIKTPIEDYIFNENLDLRDIYLASRLAEKGLLSTTNSFGKTSAQQYIAQLAPMHVHFTPDYRERGCLFRAVYRWQPCGWEKTAILIGTTFSFKQLDHFMQLDFDRGRLAANSVETLTVNPDGTVTFEDNITQFFTDYSGLFNFFHDAVLLPKQLEYDIYQQRTGFGDLGLFMEAEVRDPGFFWTDKVEIGAALTLPTGNKQTGFILWEIELGNGGAIQLDLYSSLTFKKLSFLGTMTFAGACRFSAPFTKPIRMPQIKTSKSNLILPPRFSSYFINTPSGTFYEVDSTSQSFADEVVCSKIFYGLTGIFTVSNDWDIEAIGGGASFIYQASLKALDSIHPMGQLGKYFVPAIAELQTDTVSHTITGLVKWAFSKNKKDYEVMLGTEAVVAGKNVLNTHKVFLGLTLSF